MFCQMSVVVREYKWLIVSLLLILTRPMVEVLLLLRCWKVFACFDYYIGYESATASASSIKVAFLTISKPTLVPRMSWLLAYSACFALVHVNCSSYVAYLFFFKSYRFWSNSFCSNLAWTMFYPDNKLFQFWQKQPFDWTNSNWFLLSILLLQNDRVSFEWIWKRFLHFQRAFCTMLIFRWEGERYELARLTLNYCWMLVYKDRILCW